MQSHRLVHSWFSEAILHNGHMCYKQFRELTGQPHHCFNKSNKSLLPRHMDFTKNRLRLEKNTKNWVYIKCLYLFDCHKTVYKLFLKFLKKLHHHRKNRSVHAELHLACMQFKKNSQAQDDVHAPCIITVMLINGYFSKLTKGGCHHCKQDIGN